MEKSIQSCGQQQLRKGKGILIPDDNSVALRTLPIVYRSRLASDVRGDVARELTREVDLYDDVRVLVILVRNIMESKDPWFKYSLSTSTTRNWTYRIHGEKNFRDLITAVRRDWSELYAHFPKHSFNPYVTEFLEACKAHPRLVGLAEFWPKLTRTEGAELLAGLQVLVQDLRLRGQSKAFRRVLHRIARRCRKNYHEAVKYVRSKFGQWGRHLVFRVELGYSSSEKVAPAGETSAAQVRRDLAKLQRVLRATFPLTGFIWKLEFGMLRGHHFHVLLMMDGHEKQQGQSIGKQIKEQWEGRITEGRGMCYVCRPGDYEEPGIGMLNYYDEEKRRFLERNVLPYLTKADFWMSYEPGGRTFGKGLMPLRARSVGRPRGRPDPRGLGGGERGKGEGGRGKGEGGG